MKKNVIRIVLIWMTFVIVAYGANAQQSSKVSDKLWLTITSKEHIPVWEEDQLKTSDPYLQELINNYTINWLEKTFPDSRKEHLQSVYEIGCDCDIDRLIEALAKSEFVSGIELAPVYELLGGITPNDYSIEFVEDYALDLINAKEAWEYTTGDPSIVLGVSDGSYYENHEDLQSEILMVTNSPTASANYYYHGTAVAISTAGATNNGIGKSSIGHDCKLALNTIGYNQLLNLSYAGARVVNASWAAGCGYSQYGQDVINEVNENGTIVVAAAGNGNTCGDPTALVYPAAFDNVIAVSSIGPWDNHEKVPGDSTTTHQHNASVDVCAPGYNVPLSMAPGAYLTSNGTSFAAPLVTGTIGLMLSISPCLDYELIMQALAATSVNIDGLNPEYAGSLGLGRLNAELMLEFAHMHSCSVPPNSQGVSDTQDEIELVGTSTLSEIESSQFLVFPNPTSGEVNIHVDGLEGAELEVVDVVGRIMMSTKINYTMISLNLELHEKGTYFVRIMDKGRILKTQKILRK